MNFRRVRLPRCVLYLGVGGVLPAEANVLAHRVVEQVCVLCDERHAAAQVIQSEPVDPLALQQDVAAVRVPEAHHQVGDGGLPGARTAHYGHRLARPQPEGHAGERLGIALRVGKCHFLEVDGRRFRRACRQRPS